MYPYPISKRIKTVLTIPYGSLQICGGVQLYSKYSDNKYRGHSASVLFLGQKIWNAPVHVIWHLDDTLLLVLHLNSGKCWVPQ